MAVLDEVTIGSALTSLPGWRLESNQIRKTYRFTAYRDGVAFVNRVAELAEAADHHPELLLTYSEVTVTLSSHDSGGVTERDLRLARKIDS